MTTRAAEDPLTPLQLVETHYWFPKRIVWFSKQVEVVNDRCSGRTGGLWLDMGTGKTLCSTAVALFWKIRRGMPCVVVVPVILIRQWVDWLTSITDHQGNPLTAVAYRGTPKQRQKLSLDADFVVVGAPLFKKDFPRFRSQFEGMPVVTIVDEATMVAKISSDNHEKVYEFTRMHPETVSILLSGTPANKPGDVYGLMKFTAPGTYRNLKHFENTHVGSRDFFGNPEKWEEIELLSKNLMINSSRLLLGDVYPDLDKPAYVPLYYDLDDDHYALYQRLANDELLKLPDGEKVDATTANKLRHALGQIVMNHGHFAGDPKKSSAGLDLIEQRLDELGKEKLVLFADYRMTVRGVTGRLAKYNLLPINSEVTAAQKDRNVERFISDPSCRGLVIQFISGGYGLDGLQHVCNNILFIEPCLQPRDFHQAVARLQRLGQRRKVLVHIAIAHGTLQPRAFRSLLENDTLSNSVVRSAVELRREIFGGTS